MTTGANGSSRGADSTGQRTQGVHAAVVASLPNGMFRLRMQDGREVVAHAAADLRMALTRLLAGDLVVIDVSPFDPNKARIRSLLKSQQVSQHEIHPSQPQQREQPELALQGRTFGGEGLAAGEQHRLGLGLAKAGAHLPGDHRVQIPVEWIAAASEGRKQPIHRAGPRLCAKAALARLQKRRGDVHPVPFSFRSRREPFPRLPQVDCFLTHTNERVHEMIRRHLHESPLYSGKIVGRGPRYCPSIEDKVVRFAERPRHQIFVEPEGLDTEWTYLNGLSMSLPAETQVEIVRAIPGLERAEVLRPAYAVEYDVVFPEQLEDSLELRALPGLFLAGQINGTSGYEEAAGQGLVAGANAAFAARLGERGPLVLGRHEAYIGVMIDDLVTLGTEEPYRLLTSRAEHRLLLGAETAYARLTPKAAELGLVDREVADGILEREERIRGLRGALEETPVTPDRETVTELASLEIALVEETTLAGLLRRPEVAPEKLRAFAAARLGGAAETGAGEAFGEEAFARVATEIRYAGFLVREEEAVRRLRRSTELAIPRDFVYLGLPGLSLESAEKLERHRPRTLGQASRIPGVTPAAVTLILARVAAGGRRSAA